MVRLVSEVPTGNRSKNTEGHTTDLVVNLQSYETV